MIDVKNYNSFFAQELEKENSDSVVTQKVLWYQEIIFPFYKQKGSSYQFTGAAGIRISARFFKAPHEKGIIILSTGYNESYLKYSEVIYDLYEKGFSVYCYDHRGQGFSGRLFKQNKQGVLDHFQYLVDDFISFYKRIRLENTNTPIFILAHSMGGSVVSKAVLEKKLDTVGVILSAPMFGIALHSFKFLEWPIFLFIYFMTKIGFKYNFVFGQKSCEPFSPFEENDLTHSRARFMIWRRIIDEIYEMQLGGVSFIWLAECLKSILKIRRLGKNNQTPFLLLQAEEENVTSNQDLDCFLLHCQNCKKIILNKSKHEILMEIDLIRKKAFDDIFKFISQILDK